MTESQLIHGCLKGKRSAQKMLVRRYSAQLMAVCIRYLRDREWAKDSLQETFILIFRNLENYRSTGSFEAWMTRIAITTSLKQLRAHRKIRNMDFSGINNHSSERPEVLFQMEEEVLAQLRDRLPEQYQLVFQLHVVEGYSHPEIAHLLGIEPGTSRSILARARKQLQEFFLIHQKQRV